MGVTKKTNELFNAQSYIFKTVFELLG